MFSEVVVVFFDVPDSSFWDGAIEQRAQASVQTPHPMALDRLPHTVACRGRQIGVKKREYFNSIDEAEWDRNQNVISQVNIKDSIQHCKHISASPLTKPLDMP
jgi:hypothetical protein